MLLLVRAGEAPECLDNLLHCSGPAGGAVLDLRPVVRHCSALHDPPLHLLQTDWTSDLRPGRGDC